MAPKVSVVVPFLDSADFLPAAVESVFRQTFADWELILVDGGSRDASREMAERWARERPGAVRAVRRKGLGLFQSRVLGASLARAPLVALLDSDDEWDPRYLERSLARYRRTFGERPGLLYSPVVFFEEGKRRLALQRVPPPGLYPPRSLIGEFLSSYVKTPAPTATLLHRKLLLGSRPAAKRVGKHMLEDMYLWFYLALRWPILVSAEPLSWYRQHAGSISARGRATGELERRARRHRRWLLSHVRASRLPGRAGLERLVLRSLA